MPTFWPVGRDWRMVAMVSLPPGSAEMADVAVRFAGHADVELRVAGDAEFLALAAADPGFGAGQAVFAASARAFHDFRGAGAERQRGGQDDAHGLPAAVGKGDAVRDALAVEVHIGPGG